MLEFLVLLFEAAAFVVGIYFAAFIIGCGVETATRFMRHVDKRWGK